MAASDIRIVFMGTPDFALASLEALLKHGHNVCAVVTASDKPAGRGRRLKASPVKQYAIREGIPLLQPENLKDPRFISSLASYRADLFVVVAFRILPEVVWSMPEKGTINIHASLLPQYRGAAPINRTIMNGEHRGGVTSFFLQQEVDTGRIAFREETIIGRDETAGEYHDRLKLMGAQLLLKTIDALQLGSLHLIPQEALALPGEALKTAPKIGRDDCRIDWNRPAVDIHNQVRGLSPDPGAYTELMLAGRMRNLKIFRTELCCGLHLPGKPGEVFSDNKSYLHVKCGEGCLSLLELQQAGKNRMTAERFLAGLNPAS
jgi:methionyl-tRNA formyltransferase